MRRPLVLLLALAATACGGSSSHPPASTAGDVDVSSAPQPQSSPAIAASPHPAGVLLAGANDARSAGVALYVSSDGGHRWTHSSPPRAAVRNLWFESDVGVAVAADGREYATFIAVDRPAAGGQHGTLVATTRRGARGPWSRPVLVAPEASFWEDDQDVLAVDSVPGSSHAGRLYAAWGRRHSATGGWRIVVSHSDDHGRTWSRPVVASSDSGAGAGGGGASLAIGAHGDVYVGWSQISTGSFEVARSADGGEHFGDAVFVGTLSPEAAGARCHGAYPVPATGRRCAFPGPLVAADPRSGRLYVATTTYGLDGTTDVKVTSYRRTLVPVQALQIGRARLVTPHETAPADQFLPALAVDATSGRLWVCFYTTADDTSRRTAQEACVSSRDGASYTAPRIVSGARSDETAGPADIYDAYGDVQGVVARNGVAHVVWTDGRDVKELAEEIYAANPSG